MPVFPESKRLLSGSLSSSQYYYPYLKEPAGRNNVGLVNSIGLYFRHISHIVRPQGWPITGTEFFPYSPSDHAFGQFRKQPLWIRFGKTHYVYIASAYQRKAGDPLLNVTPTLIYC